MAVYTDVVAEELSAFLADYDIGGLLALADGGPDSCDTVRDLAEAKIDTVTDKIAHLVAIRDALQELVATCERPRRDRACPLLAEVDRTDV